MERLLAETLRDENFEAFRAKTFTAGLRVLRAKRRRQAWPRNLAIAAAVAFLLAFAFLRSRHSTETTRDLKPILVSFASQPLSPSDVVRSRKETDLFVQTDAARETLEFVGTTPSLFVELNDRELLATLGERPVAFIRNGPKAQLLFLDN